MDHAAELIDQNRLLAELYRPPDPDLVTDPDLPVPTCPEWTLQQLVTHVGRGHRWAAAIVRERADAYVDINSVPDGQPPGDPDGTAAWLRDSARTLVDAVADAATETEVWTFTGPRPAAWWLRRRLHESTVHRADAAIALRVPYELPADVAADGISEWLDLVAARPANAGAVPLDIGQTLHLHATDAGLGSAGEWLVHGDGVAVSWEPGHARGAVAVRGAASDLLLAVSRRLLPDDPRVEVLGAAEVWQAWLDRTQF